MKKSDRSSGFDFVVWSLSVLLGLIFVAHEAAAEGHRYRADNARWKAECGSCHVAYPPQLLAAPAWRSIMAGLDAHFGTDASLDPAAAKEIGAFLESNAGGGRRAAPRTLRITQTRWFRREHDEVPAPAWKRPSVKTAANCAACHPGAEQGDFRERSIRIPR